MNIIKDAYIHKKDVDWSALNLGINIPVSTQIIFYELIGQFLRKGDKNNIKILIDGEEYDAKLINQHFDEKKYPKHKELLQIRYSPQSPIGKKLKSIFHKSFEYLKIKKAELDNKRIPIKVPEEIREFIMLYTTEFKDVFFLDCITFDEKKEINYAISKISEEDFEAAINKDLVDKSAKIEEKLKLEKIRKLNRAIGNNLKLIYNFRCQICGNNFGKKYNGNIVEAHHIQSFTKTMNNDVENILIICPNHHRIIHKVDPMFNKKELSYIYKNGLKEKLILNKHL